MKDECRQGQTWAAVRNKANLGRLGSAGRLLQERGYVRFCDDAKQSQSGSGVRTAAWASGDTRATTQNNANGGTRDGSRCDCQGTRDKPAASLRTGPVGGCAKQSQFARRTGHGFCPSCLWTSSRVRKTKPIGALRHIACQQRRHEKRLTASLQTGGGGLTRPVGGHRLLAVAAGCVGLWPGWGDARRDGRHRPDERMVQALKRRTIR